jgi:TMEM175 potassium channel family protein
LRAAPATDTSRSQRVRLARERTRGQRVTSVDPSDRDASRVNQQATGRLDDAVAEDEKETTRVEALSDGVFAIAITLLVIDLKTPSVDGRHANLLRAVAHNWPIYLAYATSFWSIGLAWIIHHQIFRAMRRFDHALLLINSLLLLVIALIPHPTAIVAQYLRDPAQRRYALMIYSGAWLTIAILLNLLWWYARTRTLLARDVTPELTKRMSRRLLPGPPLYLVAFVLAYFSFSATLVMYAIIGILYTLPGPDVRAARPRRRVPPLPAPRRPAP